MPPDADLDRPVHGRLSAPARAGLPLPALALLLVLACVVFAAALGYGLAIWWQPAQPWMVALVAALGVLGTLLPIAAIALGLARLGAVAPPEASPTVPAPVSSGLHGVMLSHEQFTELIAREWSRSRRYGTGAALLLAEIDRYERLVDALGDAAGEKVLAQLMGATALTLRGADALTRRGPGQMAIFLAHADATGALDVAERVRERAERMEVALPPRRVRFTTSVGVAHLRTAHLHQQALLDDVGEALTAARSVGGNCVRAAPVEVGPPAKPGPTRDGFRTDRR